MSNATEIKIENCKVWSRGERKLVVQSGSTIVIAAAEVNVADQAAICYVLLDMLADRCGIAPFSVEKAEIEHVLDSLSSIAEFPSIQNE